MKEDRIKMEKLIFCTPEKEPKKKKEPPYDVRVRVEAGSWGSFKVGLMERNSSGEKATYYFSDRKSMQEMVDGLSEFLKFLDSEVKQ